MNPQPKENTQSGGQILFNYYIYVIPQILSFEAPNVLEQDVKNEKQKDIHHKQEQHQQHQNHYGHGHGHSHGHDKSHTSGNSENLQLSAKKYTVKAFVNGKLVGQINHAQNTFGNSNNQRNNKIKIHASGGSITLKALMDDKQFGDTIISIDPIIQEMQSSNGPVEKNETGGNNKYSFNFIVRGDYV